MAVASELPEPSSNPVTVEPLEATADSPTDSELSPEGADPLSLRRILATCQQNSVKDRNGL